MEKKNGRLQELDALRGLAALAVVLFHYTTRYDELFGHEKQGYLNFSYGHLGVNLFFMISGFVIFMTLLRTKSIGEFAKKRALRLYPAYIVAVIVTFVAVKIYGLEGRGVSLFEAIFNLTMLQGFIPGVDHVDGVYWSLAVEMTFYIMAGLAIFFCLRKHVFKLVVGWLIISILLQVLIIAFDGSIIAKLLSFYSIVSYSHLFIAGIMFYLIREKAEVKYYLVLAGCLISQFAFNDLISSVITISFFAVFYFMIHDKMKFLNTRLLTFLGAISYSWYLIHQNLGYIVLDYIEGIGLVHEVFLVIPLLGSIVLATILTYYVEKPILEFFSKKNKQQVRIKQDVNRELSKM